MRYCLEALKSVARRIVFVSTSPLTAEAIRGLKGLCAEVVTRKNRGYDFLSYRVGLSKIDGDVCDEVILCNDSVYGPLRPLGTLFASMDRVDCDFWGLTDSRDFGYHLQSYFLVFRRRALSAPAFERFWRGVRALGDKRRVIRGYEIPMTRILAAAGLEPAAFVDLRKGGAGMWRRAWRNRSLRNPVTLKVAAKQLIRNRAPAFNVTHLFWDEIVRHHGMPFLKVELLRDNPLCIPNVSNWPSLIESVGDYPAALIRAHLERVGRRE